jgi:hypothetical protein
MSKRLNVSSGLYRMGTDYEQNPEHKLTLTMLGAFAVFERAKFIERTSRGRFHRLRMGEPGVVPHRDKALVGISWTRISRIATVPARCSCKAGEC